jgi:hypothetical protein
MLGLDLADGPRIASIVILGLSLVILFVVVSASGARRSSQRRRFRTAYPLFRPNQYRGFDPADPAQQLNAVMAASFHRQRVLSRSEYRVFKIIEDEITMLRRGYRVFAQTCLGEVLRSPDRNAFLSINSKRADILVVDGGGWPALVVEYQGEGHYQGAAAARDAVKKEALRKAGVRHFEVQPTDSDDKIRSLVREQFGWTTTSPADPGGARSNEYRPASQTFAGDGRSRLAFADRVEDAHAPES